MNSEVVKTDYFVENYNQIMQNIEEEIFRNYLINYKNVNYDVFQNTNEYLKEKIIIFINYVENLNYEKFDEESYCFYIESFLISLEHQVNRIAKSNKNKNIMFSDKYNLTLLKEFLSRKLTNNILYNKIRNLYGCTVLDLNFNDEIYSFLTKICNIIKIIFEKGDEYQNENQSPNSNNNLYQTCIFILDKLEKNNILTNESYSEVKPLNTDENLKFNNYDNFYIATNKSSFFRIKHKKQNINNSDMFKQNKIFEPKSNKVIKKIQGDIQIDEFDEDLFSQLKPKDCPQNLMEEYSGLRKTSNKNISYDKDRKYPQDKFTFQQINKNSIFINKKSDYSPITPKIKQQEERLTVNKSFGRKSSIVFQDIPKSELKLAKEVELTPKKDRKSTLEKIEKIDIHSMNEKHKSYSRTDLHSIAENQPIRKSINANTGFSDFTGKMYKIVTPPGSTVMLPEGCKHNIFNNLK